MLGYLAVMVTKVRYNTLKEDTKPIANNNRSSHPYLTTMLWLFKATRPTILLLRTLRTLDCSRTEPVTIFRLWTPTSQIVRFDGRCCSKIESRHLQQNSCNGNWHRYRFFLRAAVELPLRLDRLWMACANVPRKRLRIEVYRDSTDELGRRICYDWRILGFE